MTNSPRLDDTDFPTRHESEILTIIQNVIPRQLGEYSGGCMGRRAPDSLNPGEAIWAPVTIMTSNPTTPAVRIRAKRCLTAATNSTLQGLMVARASRKQMTWRWHRPGLSRTNRPFPQRDRLLTSEAVVQASTATSGDLQVRDDGQWLGLQ